MPNSPMLSMVVIGSALLCHFGLRLTLYNRLNGLGFSRHTIKTTEKWLFAETWLTPIVILACNHAILWNIGTGNASLSSLHPGLVGYGTACLLIGGVFGLLWICWRPILGVQTVDASRQIEVVDVSRQVSSPLPCTRKCRMAAKIPGNQIFELSIERIQLPVASLPAQLEGYRIAHLSDVHLTGQIRADLMHYIMRSAMDWQPHLMAITGDIIDKQPCINWLPDIFSVADAEDGCHFILGNHDTRVADPSQIRDAMTRSGWNDLGSQCQIASIHGLSVALIGNESPWFGRPNDSTLRVSAQEADFRLCLSHSPDQFDWCRRHGIELMLAGHTHGGQGRLPIAGPILSPSLHGSRWASGDFYRAPTTLHVSRGLCGVHLLRINCRPELSLITLRKMKSDLA